MIAAARERRVCVLAVTHEERWARENAETRFRLEDGRSPRRAVSVRRTAKVGDKEDTNES